MSVGPLLRYARNGLAISLLTIMALSGASLAEDAPAPAAAPSPAAAAPAATPPAAPAKSGDATEAPAPVVIPVYYLGKKYQEPLPLSYAERPIFDKGIQGARMYAKQANQSGAFVGMGFKLVEAIVPENGDVVAKAKEILKNGDALIVADLEPKDLLAVADLPEAKNSVIMNIRSSAEALRQEECRPNVFHIIPDWAMRADALGQYLIVKKWPRWLVIRGDPRRQGLSRHDASAPPNAMAARSCRRSFIPTRRARAISTLAISRSRLKSPW